MSRQQPDYPEPRASCANRRGEPRRRTDGTGWMELLDSLGREAFQLVDISSSGFRVCHHFGALSAGQKVRFHHEQGEGVAVAVWNRHFGDAVESGFLVVSDRK